VTDEKDPQAAEEKDLRDTEEKIEKGEAQGDALDEAEEIPAAVGEEATVEGDGSGESLPEAPPSA